MGPTCTINSEVKIKALPSMAEPSFLVTENMREKNEIKSPLEGRGHSLVAQLLPVKCIDHQYQNIKKKKCLKTKKWLVLESG